MKETYPTKVEKILDLDYSETDKIWLSGQKALRRLVGILGVLLPILLVLFLWADTGYTKPLESISHYYMTRASSVFVIVVSLLAIFLLVYKGKNPIDFYISFAAGIFALCVILFPTGNITDDSGVSVTTLKLSSFRTNFHFIAAAIFLLSLSYMSLFLFTRSDKPLAQRTKQKYKRNIIYRVCGIVMVLAVGTIFLAQIGILPNPRSLTFWMETVAVESFGISWLVKGELVLKDQSTARKS